jgi:hypothetical protein
MAASFHGIFVHDLRISCRHTELLTVIAQFAVEPLAIAKACKVGVVMRLDLSRST